MKVLAQPLNGSMEGLAVDSFTQSDPDLVPDYLVDLHHVYHDLLDLVD